MEVGIKRSRRKGSHFIPLRKMNREEDLKKIFQTRTDGEKYYFHCMGEVHAPK